MTIDDLMDKSVKVEVQLHAGTGGRSEGKTMIYEGVYKGYAVLGSVEMLHLTDASHFNMSGVNWPDNSTDKDKRTTRIFSPDCFISLQYVISIDVVPQE